MTFTQQARKLRTKDNNIFEIFRLFEKFHAGLNKLKRIKF